MNKITLVNCRVDQCVFGLGLGHLDEVEISGSQIAAVQPIWADSINRLNIDNSEFGPIGSVLPPQRLNGGGSAPIGKRSNRHERRAAKKLGK